MTAKSYDLTDGHEPMSHAEIDCLKALAVSLPPNPLIVNIGAATGVSTCAFLEARPDCFIFSVDTEPCDDELEHAGRPRNLVRLLGDSKEIGCRFPYLADLVFVDGDHWNAAGDILAWLDKVKPGGIMAFHDYIVPPNPPENPGDVYNQVNAGMGTYEQLTWVDRVVAYRCL